MALPNEQQLLDDITHARGEAKSLKSLHALYGLKGRERVALRRLIEQMVQAGRLVRLRGPARFGVPRGRETIEGVLQGTSRGFAFVSPDDPALPDVFVRAAALHGALHGDRVAVSIEAGGDPARLSGEIAGILERADARIVGLIERGSASEMARLLPFDPRVSVEIVIPARFRMGAEAGVFVEALLLRDARAGRGDGPLSARVVAILGRPEEPGTDVRVILRSFRLLDQHSEEAVQEADRRARAQPDPAMIARRKDFRHLPTVTIDGETARDFDDAISVEPLADGRIRLHVHIADVAEYVVEGTALDAEAHERATSVYFPDRAVHMLPEGLSAGACSLLEGEDRLTLTATLDFDVSGSVVATSFHESIIRSDRRMTYAAMKRIVVDRDDELRRAHEFLLPDLELMAELAGRLIERREARGGLNFDLPVPIVKVDEDGLVTDIVESERNAAHRIIEEFMIAANEAVARFLEREGEPCVYRNHEPPPPEKMAAFQETAATFGYAFDAGDPPAPQAFQRVLDAARGKAEEYLLTTLALRSMAQARYEADCKGHFGLALTHYTHFTSPIRRYPDLIVHRALKRRLNGDRMPPAEAAEIAIELQEEGEHCSKAERNAEAAERMLVEWKKAAFMRDRVGGQFEGRVVGITERGIYVMLLAHHVEGFARLQDLARDWYDRDERGVRLVGRDSGRVLKLGDLLRVIVTEVDVLRRRINLAEIR